MLAANARARLVRGAGARGRDLFRPRGRAPCRLAGPADPLGAAARSSATLRPAGPALYRSRPPRPATDRAMVYPTLALVEVTFREVRDHLGVETQRQWSDRAIARTTPCLLALFSIVTLLAARLDRHARSAVCTDAWYRKPRPTFADALGAVRRQFWREQGLLLSARQAEVRKLRPTLRHGIAYALCQAA